jgi:PAS domain S-box-containing protein
MNTLIALGIITLAIQVAILVYGYKVMKIADFIPIWKRGWLYFIISESATLLRRGCEACTTTFPDTAVYYVLSLISDVFLFLFIYSMAQVFRYLNKLNNESTFVTLLRNLPAGVVVHSEDNNVLFSNAKAAEILGVSKDDIGSLFEGGCTDWNFLDEKGEPIFLEDMPTQIVLSTGEPLLNKVYGISREDDVIWVLCNAYLLNDEKEAKQVVVVFTDVTELRNAVVDLRHAEAVCRETGEIYRNAFMSSHDAIIISRMSDGLINSVNTAFTSITGYLEKEAVGKTVFDIHLWKVPGDRRSLLRNVAELGQVRDYRVCFLGKDGKEIDGLLSSSYMRIDDEDYMLTSVKEICKQSHKRRKEDKTNPEG